jgi:VWFA-related protein
VDRKFMKGPGDKVLEEFAADSGGRAFFPYRVDDLAQAFANIGDELRSQYSLAYIPNERTADGKYHRIRIEVATKGLKVQARRGYFADVAEALGPADTPRGN